MPGLWICLIILHVGSKCARAFNVERLYMKCLCSVLNLSEYASICLSNAWMSQYPLRSLNVNITEYVPEYTWQCLNKLTSLCQRCQYVSSSYWQDFEYASGIKHVGVLNILWYSHNSIIIIATNALILEPLSAGFVCPGVPQRTILCLFNKSRT